MTCVVGFGGSRGERVYQNDLPWTAGSSLSTPRGSRTQIDQIVGELGFDLDPLPRSRVLECELPGVESDPPAGDPERRALPARILALADERESGMGKVQSDLVAA